jgi:CheY-like chemotaxis protein
MKTIWIVDDDEEMLRAMDLMLRMLKFKTRFFMHARPTAEALLAGEKPDIILLDINMPEVSGMDVLEFIRRNKRWNKIPIVMLSTEAADVTVDQAMSLGADGYVTKPVMIDELEADLHPDMLEPLIKLFINPETNPHNAQIIFSTHSHEVMDLLDKEQIVLVEKDEACNSEAWRLDEVSGVRRSDNLYAKYRSGAYGAVPNI